MQDSLGHALESLRANNDEDALNHLLMAWRFDRLPEIAELIDFLSARITKKRERIVAKTVRERNVRWLTIAEAKDPADVGRLLSAPWPGNWQDATKLFDQVLAWPDDPRVAMELARVVDAYPYRSLTAGSLYQRILLRIATIADIRVLEILGTKSEAERNVLLATDVGAHERTTVQALREIIKHEIRDPNTLTQLRGCFGSEIAAKKENTRGAQELLEAIYKNVNDDDVRHVYADFLSERGDLRGEMITLQLARARGAATEAMVRREHALLHTSELEKEWAASLDSYCHVDNRVYERGFLSKASLLPNVMINPESVFADPAWATVGTLDVRHILGGDINAGVAAVLEEGLAKLRQLFGIPFVQERKAIVGLNEVAATMLARRLANAPAFTTVANRLEELGILLRYEPLEPAALTSSTAFPSVTRLHVHLPRSDHDARWLFESALWKQIVHLHVSGTNVFGAWLLAARKHPKLASLTFTIGAPSSGTWTVTFRDHEKTGARFASAQLHFTSGSQRAYNIGSDLALILRTIARTPPVHELVVEPARALRPNLKDRTTFEGELASSNIAHIDVPWERGGPQEASPSPTAASTTTATTALLLYVNGEWLLPKVSDVLAIMASSKLVPAYDSFRVNHGVERPLGKDPASRLATWAQKKTTRTIKIYRDGPTSSMTALALAHRPSSSAKVDGRFYPPIASSELTVGCLAPADGDSASEKAFRDRYLDWLTQILNRFEINWGVSAVSRNGLRLEVLSNLNASPGNLEWMTIFGPHHEPLFPREELLKLPMLLGPAIGASVHVTSRNVVIVSAPSPLTPPDAGRGERWQSVLSPIFQAAFLRHYGWDPYSHIADALKDAMQDIGLTRDTTNVRADSVVFRRTTGVEGSLVGVFIELENALSYPLLAVTCGISRSSTARNWDRRFLVESRDGPYKRWLAGSRDELEKSLVAIRTRIKTEVVEWFKAHQVPLPTPAPLTD